MENRIGFGPRLGAYLLDLVLISVIAVVLVPVLGLSGAALGAAAGTDETTAMLGMAGGFLGGFMASLVAIYVVYVVWFLLEGLTGFTIGKLIVGIRVGNQDGTKASVGNLLVRYILKNIGIIILSLSSLLAISAIGLLGNLLALVIFIGCFLVLGAKKQAIHDMIAKTAVFKKSSLA